MKGLMLVNGVGYYSDVRPVLFSELVIGHNVRIWHGGPPEEIVLEFLHKVLATNQILYAL